MADPAATSNGNATPEGSSGSARKAATKLAEAAAAAAANAGAGSGNGATTATVSDGKGRAFGIAVAAVDRSEAMARVDRLAAQIAAAPHGGSKLYQAQLARATSFLPRLRLPMNEDLIDQAEIALGALLSEPPSLVLAARTNGSIRWALFTRSYNPATRMMVGVAVLSYFFAFGWLLAGGKILGLDVQSLLGPAVFGWLGSVASMVTRINSFRKVENPITVGATRPLLGAAFGIFTYLALQSGIVTIGDGNPKPELFIAIAFIAGFSERFVPDLISQVEDLAGTSKAEVVEQPASG